MKQLFTLFAFFLTACVSLTAQDVSPLIKQYLLDNQQKLQLAKEDITDGWVISDQYLTRHNQVTQAYVQQTLHGLKLYNAVSSAAVKNGSVVVFNSAFTQNAAQLVNAKPGTQQLSPRQAVLAAAANLEIPLLQLKEISAYGGPDKDAVFTAEGVVKEPVKVSLLYQKTDEDIRLAWNVTLQAKSDWWHVRVDALTGEILDKGNYTVYCDFGPDAYRHIHDSEHPSPVGINRLEAPESLASGYRVFPFPGESPTHTPHQLIGDPSDPVASPFGWHDTNGQAGAEYTITRGNNVLASEDRDDNNFPGYSPDGGAGLLFDFPYDQAQLPLAWEDAAITNLFYANNFMHDMSYRHGFDEAAGNFQQNNYGNGGQGNDAVQADAQDGSGTNNANFSTPSDGNSGRMQMYVWTGGGIPGGDSIVVNSPAVIAGTYNAPVAGFGPAISTPITGDIAMVVDNTAPVNNGCDSIVNGAQLMGKIAMLDRGTCGYIEKVQAAQDAGAIAVIVVQNSAAGPLSMPGSSTTITIPSMMISLAHGQLIRDQLLNGPVNITIIASSGTTGDRDSDLDNGIIAHEYAHGISIRMTGGPSNSGCLDNEEQMGEGWADYYSLITTMHPADTRTTRRAVGTYSLGQPAAGTGIRNKIYSTDMTVNNYTYGSLPGTGGEVHNIGELWTTFLWDLTWDLIDKYGFEPNVMASTGGNNIAQQLVTDGFKLQKCNPGFVDGRDAILQADELNYGGANKCLIWEAFARRGLGYSAKQGSSNDYADGTEAFDLPPLCQTAVLAPVADFNADRTTSCLDLATIQFTDQSQNIAQYLLWDFGDGNTSTLTNPLHTYAAEGTYTVTLIVTNNIGVDTIVKTGYISISSIPGVQADDVTICAGQSASLTVTPNIAGNTAEWSDAAGNVVFTGTTFNTPVLTSSTTYVVNEAENRPVGKVGPVGFGSGSIHNSSIVGRLYFTAEKAVAIKTVLVRAEGSGNREIRLYNAFGDVIASVNVNIPDGDSRINLNLEIPVPGDYSIGAGPNINLFRSNGGITYPYKIDGLVSITGSTAATRYYYFYDWEVQELPCRGATSEVTVDVTPGPIANFTSTTNGLTTTFSNLSTGNPTTWLWDFGDGATSSLPNVTHTYATMGVYTVVLTVSNGTCTTVFSQVLDFTSGTNVLNPDQFNVQLTPNPATNVAFLNLVGTPGSRNIQIGLYSADGRLVHNLNHDTAQGSNVRLDLNGLPAGMYLVKVQAAVGLVIRKLVVE